MATTDPTAALDTSANASSCIPWTGAIDTDGIQLCPPLPPTGPWALTRCAFDQAKTFNAGTQQQNQSMQNLSAALENEDSKGILQHADELNLRVCRVNKYDDKQKLIDSYLVLATKPGVHDYSGPFIYKRKNEFASNYIFHIPHDGYDGTCPSMEQVFDQTYARVAIANGSPRDLATQKGACTDRPISDIAHNTNNLAWTAFKSFTANPDTMVIEFHGMKGSEGGSGPGLGMIITNGLARTAGQGTLLYAFAQAVANRFKDASKAEQDSLQVCAPGTPLTYRQQCSLRDTWVQGRALNGSTNPQCGSSQTMSNRFVGFEQAQKYVQKPGIMTPIIKELEQTYPKPVVKP